MSEEHKCFMVVGAGIGPSYVIKLGFKTRQLAEAWGNSKKNKDDSWWVSGYDNKISKCFCHRQRK